MILIVDMIQPSRYDAAGGAWRSKRRFENITGQPCVVMNYPDASIQFVEQYPIQAIFITGFGYGWGNVPVRKLRNISDLMHATDIPTLAACGGHQLLGFIFNKDLRRVRRLTDEPMRKLRPREPDVNHAYHPGYFTETGIHVVEIVKRDPLFRRLPKRMLVPQAHYCEIKRLPKGFVLLASNANCRIQAMRHKNRPIYGTQFHPEAWTDDYTHGKQIVTNLFRMAGLV